MTRSGSAPPEASRSRRTGSGIPSVVGFVQHAVDHRIVTGVVSADAALREGSVTLDQLTEQVSAVATWPHSSRAASMLRLVDGRRESVGSRCGVASRWRHRRDATGDHP